jgi:RimJ/RimL family protein N-acetyltransferase
VRKCGYGMAAMSAIRDLMRREHPDVAELVLTVNCRNTAAISTYLKAGFRDTGEIYHGGNSGPQHVFYLPLR